MTGKKKTRQTQEATPGRGYTPISADDVKDDEGF